MEYSGKKDTAGTKIANINFKLFVLKLQIPSNIRIAKVS